MRMHIRRSVKSASVWLPRVLALWLFLLPWQTRWIIARTMWQGGIWEYGTVGVFVMEILLWAVFIFFIVSRCAPAHYEAGGHIIKKHHVAIASTILLAVYYIARSSYSLVALQALIHIGEAIGAGYIMFQTSRDMAHAQMLRRWFLGGICLQAILALTQFVTQQSVSARVFGLVAHNAWMGGTSVIENTGGRWVRAYGAFPHPNILGGYMVIGIIFLMYELLSAKAEHTARDMARVIGILLCLGLVTGGLLVSFSRSAWLACAIGVCVVSWRAMHTDARHSFQRIVQAWLVIMAVACVSVSSAPDLFFTRTHLADRLEIKSVEERAASYRDAWLVFRTAPVWGVGPGNFTAVLHARDGARNVWEYQPVHNAFLLMMIELGILPMVLLIWYAARRLRVRNIPPHAWSVIAALGVLALFDHYLWSLLSGLMLAAVALMLKLPDSQSKN